MYSEEESLSVGKNIGGNFFLIIEEDCGIFFMIIWVFFFLIGEDCQCYFVVILNEWIFGRMIFLCGFYLKVQEDCLGFMKDFEKVILNLIDFMVMGCQVEGVILKEILEVNECIFF